MSKNINNVIVAGKIAQINAQEKFVGAKILVDTGRKTHEDKPIIARIDVVGNGFVADRMRNLAEGDAVLAEGRFYSSAKEGKDTAYGVNLSGITKMDAGDFNHIVVSGRLVADAEERTTSNGNTVTNFRIATDYNYKVGEEWKTITSFFPVVFWGNVEQALTKGSLVWITGALSPRSYEKDGVRHYLTDINAESVTLGGTGKSGSNGGNTGDTTAEGFMEADEEEEELPW